MPHPHPLPVRLARLAAAAGTAALLAACAASSPERTGPSRPAGGHGNAAFIGGYDADNDARVTRAEYDAVRKQRYAAADTNGDGWLSEAEYVAEFQGRLQRQYADGKRQPDDAYANAIKQAHVRFGILDRNKDGRLTVDEEQAIADRTFRNADTNGDGVVDAADAKKP
ncbi:MULTISPECIES: EF-hand domain-containing protein [Comamonadaceae]|uniref:EF-hand domain-containing protein n=1 Tax=Acidovorax sacchari TaxID=3230736 RepID=UPI0034A5724A